MSNRTVAENLPVSAGLLRATLAGPGRTLADAFDNMERAPRATQILHHPQRRLRSARISLTPDEGDGHWDLTQSGKDIYVVVENFIYREPRAELIPGDGLIQFYFKLTGDLTMEVNQYLSLRLNRPSLLIYNHPRGIDISERIAPLAHERCVAITVQSEFLVKDFLSSGGKTSPQLESILRGATSQLRYLQIPLSPHIFDLATKLVENPYCGTLSLLHTEAVTQQLLCAALFASNLTPDLASSALNERNLRCLQAARRLLSSQFSPAPSIRQVARAVGISETFLKREFKGIFGETIFEFSVRCRMRHALTLLHQQQLSIESIALAVGYRHATSFATAFRRHFGFCPSDIFTPM